MKLIKNLIRSIINELHIVSHFNDRVNDRLKDIEEITFPKELHQEFNKDDRQLNDYKSFILNSIKSKVSSKVQNLKSIIGKNDDILYIFIIAKAVIKYKGRVYNPILKSTDKPDQVNGNVWFTGVYNEIARTLLIGKKDDDYYLMDQFKQHYSRKDGENDVKRYIDSGEFMENTIVTRVNNYVVEIDLDELFVERQPERKVVAKREIPSKADYRKGSKYEHPKFGPGKILSRKFVEEKDGDRYYNVEIQFDQPSVGTKTLRLKNK